MSVDHEISEYIASQPVKKEAEILTLHSQITQLFPGSILWFLDGKNEDGKVVANPSIGYGSYTIQYADGSTKEFYRVGLSANTTGISVYIMGLDDKGFLMRTYADSIGKASITGYCIKFRSLKDIDLDVLLSAIRFRLELDA